MLRFQVANRVFSSASKNVMTVGLSSKQHQKQTQFLVLSAAALWKPTTTLLTKKGAKKGGDDNVGFDAKDVPTEQLKSPIWDREDFDNIFMGEDFALMGEDDLALMESLDMLSDEEVEMLAKDSEVAMEGKKKDKKK